MRIFISILVERSLLLNSGSAIHENETTNCGGYLDYVLDEHWLKADSKACARCAPLPGFLGAQRKAISPLS